MVMFSPRLPLTGQLSADTISPAEEIAHLAKRVAREKCLAVRLALLSAIDQLVSSIREHEGLDR